MKKMRIFNMYTDAATLNVKSVDNPNAMGKSIATVGATIILDNKYNEIWDKLTVRYLMQTQYAELDAIVVGLKHLVKTYGEKYVIVVNCYTDNLGNVKDYKKLDEFEKANWMYFNKRENEEKEIPRTCLWKEIKEMEDKGLIKINLIHVKGHRGKVIDKKKDRDIYYNEQCDTRATKYKREHYEELKEKGLYAHYQNKSLRNAYGREHIFDKE